MEMYAEDHPDEFKFVRAGEQQPLTQVEMLAKMESKLIGKAHDSFWSRLKPSKAVLEKAALLSKAGEFLKGVARKGGS